MIDERSAPVPLNNRAPDPIRGNLARRHSDRAAAFRARMQAAKEGDCGCGKTKAEIAKFATPQLIIPAEPAP